MPLETCFNLLCRPNGCVDVGMAYPHVAKTLRLSVPVIVALHRSVCNFFPRFGIALLGPLNFMIWQFCVGQLCPRRNITPSSTDSLPREVRDLRLFYLNSSPSLLWMSSTENPPSFSLGYIDFADLKILSLLFLPLPGHLASGVAD